MQNNHHVRFCINILGVCGQKFMVTNQALNNPMLCLLKIVEKDLLVGDIKRVEHR